MIEEYLDEEENEDEIEYYAVRPNKTKIKKDITAMFNLGNEMSALSASNLKQLGLPQDIHEAIVQIGGMGQTGARKRLLKYAAGKLHILDGEILDAVTEQFARLKNQSAHAVREHHIAERWRDRLIAEGDTALADLFDEHPNGDRQQLRQLLRNVQKEAATGNPPKSARLLYRYLKELLNTEDALSSEHPEDEDLDEDEED